MISVCYKMTNLRFIIPITDTCNTAVFNRYNVHLYIVIGRRNREPIASLITRTDCGVSHCRLPWKPMMLDVVMATSNAGAAAGDEEITAN